MITSTWNAVLLVTLCYVVQAIPNSPPQQPDSYAVIPQVGPSDDTQTSELNLGMSPPAENAGPSTYDTNPGSIVAVPLLVPVKVDPRMRREVGSADKGKDETLVADETVIIGPPSGARPFGTPLIHLGYRPGRAYYARRYHKYPWNYH